MAGLVPCNRCHRQIPRHESLSGRHLSRCRGEYREHFVEEALASLENGHFTDQIQDWRDNDIEGRLRREYIAWREAGCPPWSAWRTPAI
jgi:hypothetical protein